jgi:hypothetical protein
MARLRCDCGTRSLQAAGSKLVAFWLLTANQFLATPQKPAFLLEKVARPERFELPTFWFVVGKAGNPKALQVSHLQAAPASTLAVDNYTERTWIGVVMGEEIKKIMMTYVKYPPRKVQSYGYTGPITLSGYERFQWIRDQLAKEGISVHLPTEN